MTDIPQADRNAWGLGQQAGAQAVHLTDEERSRVDARARRELVEAVLAQAAFGLGVALISGWIGGVAALLSALAGSLAYLLPNVLFAARLFVATFRPSGASPVVFLVGEFLKVLATILLLWIVAREGVDRVNWLACLVGLIATLKGYLLVLFVRLAKAR